ncbi:unnamed protein product [Rotaria socialis]|uniref:Uncharacterized protein n=1 Tax=Rotaria socialis TaxID=392032 RepID=A0A818PLF9_9BILA|nr:unnamed protein product [Rotaria socialis]CAF4343831.1 unnamed protein product [Rotaria socialis]
MRHTANIFTLIFIIFLYSTIYCSSVPNESLSAPLLLLISFDGFRWNYPDLYHLPNFNLLSKRGVRVKYIQNNFATLTFPLHYSIITGLYEESHGIVGNTIFDPKLNAVTTLDTMNDTRWWSQNSYSQPIWTSNELANDSYQRRSGVIAWPSIGTPINGHLPVRYQLFNLTRKFDSILQQIIDWFREPAESRINLGVVYYPEPDMTGHHHGPISDEMNKTLKECDDYVGQLLAMIDIDEYLKRNLNVIITSDHGMESIRKNRTIILADYIDTKLCSAYGSRSSVNIFVPLESNINRIYANLSTIPNFEVYKKSQIPDEYHYKSNIRIGDILFVAKAGYEIIAPGDNASIELLGDHGYDDRVESMHGIFYGFGPAFHENMQVEPFHTVDIYPLMSYILKLKERKTNGSIDNVKHILRHHINNDLFDEISVLLSKTTSYVTSWGFITDGCVLLVILISIVYIIVAFRHSRQLIYAEPQFPIRYRLLSNDEGSKNNFFPDASDNEELE